MQLWKLGGVWAVCVTMCMPTENKAGFENKVGFEGEKKTKIFRRAFKFSSVKLPSTALPSSHSQEHSNWQLQQKCILISTCGCKFSSSGGQEKFVLSHFEQNLIENKNELIMNTVKHTYMCWQFCN